MDKLLLVFLICKKLFFFNLAITVESKFTVGTYSSLMSTIFCSWAILISIKHYCGLSILDGYILDIQRENCIICNATWPGDMVKESPPPPSRTKWTFPVGPPVLAVLGNCPNGIGWCWCWLVSLSWKKWS